MSDAKTIASIRPLAPREVGTGGEVVAVVFIFVLIVVACGVGCGLCEASLAHSSRAGQQVAAEADVTFHGVIVGVVDGDTIDVRFGPTEDREFLTLRVRLAEIDAPERGQPWGKQARDAVKDDWILDEVRINYESLDRNGRIVGTVTRESDGENLNASLVRRGLAWHYTRYSKSEHLAALQKAAQESKRGLWADASPVAPETWRRRKRTKRSD